MSWFIAGRDALLDTIDARAGDLRQELAELKAREEELAVKEATEPRGVLDQISVIRSRTQRALEKEREAYLKYKRRRRGARARGDAGTVEESDGLEEDD